MHWAAFAHVAPVLAQVARTIFQHCDVALIGILRRDGSPRISPRAPDVTNGRLYFGMTWRSYQALDLLRDPHCTVHGLIHNRIGKGGEFKLHGRATTTPFRRSMLSLGSVHRKSADGKIPWRTDNAQNRRNKAANNACVPGRPPLPGCSSVVV